MQLRLCALRRISGVLKVCRFNRMMDSQVKRYLWTRTALVYLSYTAHGMLCSLGGPALPDLMEHMNVTPEQMGLAGSVSSVIHIVFSLGVGQFIARFHHHIDLIIAVAFLVRSLSDLIIPITTSIYVYTAAGLVGGMGATTYDQSNNILILSLWGQKGAAIQGLHCFFSLGYSIGPYIIRPFLGPDHLNNTAEMPNTTYNGNVTLGVEVQRELRIYIAYFIVAALLFLISVCSFIAYLKGQPRGLKMHIKPQEKCQNMFKCCKRTDPNFAFVFFISVCFSFYYFLNACEDSFVSGWLVYYAIKSDLKFTKKEAVLLDGATKFSFFVGRILASLLALKVSAKVLMFVGVYGVFVSILGLAYLGTVFRPCLWVFSSLFMLFCAPKWPAGITWTNLYIPLAGNNFALLNISAGIGWMFVGYLIGWLFTHRSPNDVIMVPIVIGAIMCGEVLLMQCVASRHGERSVSDEQEEDGEEMHKLVKDSDLEGDDDEEEEIVVYAKEDGLY